MKRSIKSFEADEDVARMLTRAMDGGVKLTFLCNVALRRLLTERGFAGKKDLTCPAARNPVALPPCPDAHLN
ncbi:MAG TPA: hypothetical protein VF607_02465 [Verrucomicrobiae bacterium]